MIIGFRYVLLDFLVCVSLQKYSGIIGKSYLSQNKWEKSDSSKGLYIYDDHRIGEGQVFKICHLFLSNWSIVYFYRQWGLGWKNWSFFCGCQKWIIPNVINLTNLAVTQDPRDHDPGHARIQNKELFNF